MIVKINGVEKEIKDDVTIAEILVLENVDMPDYVSVQLNGNFVDKQSFSGTHINENDEVEFLYFMGGGAK